MSPEFTNVFLLRDSRLYPASTVPESAVSPSFCSFLPSPDSSPVAFVPSAGRDESESNSESQSESSLWSDVKLPISRSTQAKRWETRGSRRKNRGTARNERHSTSKLVLTPKMVTRVSWAVSPCQARQQYQVHSAGFTLSIDFES